MKTKDISIIGMLIALSFILANVKINGSIALDSVPAFLALFLFKDYKAGVIGALGHLMSAFLAGFAMGLPIHLCIALTMYCMLILGVVILKRSNIIVTIIFIFIVNSFVSPLILLVLKLVPTALSIGLMPSLALVTTLNLIIALVLLKPCRRVFKIEKNIE